jgi:hypothetical protein
LNDLNTLRKSLFLKDWNDGAFRNFQYTLNDKDQIGAFVFVDGLYPNWSCFAKTIFEPRTPQEKYFAKVQEGVRKDIERSYGVLQKRFAIVRQPARCWYLKKMKKIMKACLILQNMIIRDKQRRFEYGVDRTLDPLEVQHVENLPQVRVYHDTRSLVDFLYTQSCGFNNAEHHFSLKTDLLNHLWKWKGAQLR